MFTNGIQKYTGSQKSLSLPSDSENLAALDQDCYIFNMMILFNTCGYNFCQNI